MKFNAVFLLIISAMLCACATTQHQYYWGSYEETLYNMYHEPGSAPPSQQIITLNETIQQAQASGKSPGPGLYAHLGFMYALDGQPSKAQEAFQTEIALYPDSSVMIKGMLERANKQKK